jgi:error-prone DNA polymerase
MSGSGGYAELGVMSNFSFLEGASHPGELMSQAKALGLAAVGVADRNTLAGMVRAAMGAETADLKLIVGSRLAFTDGTELIVFPRDRAAYGRLCRLLSLGKSEAFAVSSLSRSDGEGDHPQGGGGAKAAHDSRPSTASRSPSPLRGEKT